jgi:nitrogen regulatory protein PII-like uncharacterized protein
MFPSMTGFFALCDYLGVTPRDFFDAEKEQPARLSALTENLKKLDEDALAGITNVVEKMLRK